MGLRLERRERERLLQARGGGERLKTAQLVSHLPPPLFYPSAFFSDSLASNASHARNTR